MQVPITSPSVVGTPIGVCARFISLSAEDPAPIRQQGLKESAKATDKVRESTMFNWTALAFRRQRTANPGCIAAVQDRVLNQGHSHG